MGRDAREDDRSRAHAPHPDPEQAVLLGLRITHELLHGHGAPALDGICYQPRGRQTLRNIREPVELFAAIPQGQPDHGKLPIDPVCQMAVDPKHSVGRLIFEDTAYFFCTLACAAEFARHPERFID